LTLPKHFYLILQIHS